MKPELQRIAIAEACGYRKGENEPSWWATPKGQPFKACSIKSLPDYLNDLNAMHEAEKACLLSKGKDKALWERYDNLLFSLCGGFARAHATAAQRAEAFLRTIGKWEDDDSSDD